jgi:hypothetical protein
LHHSLSFQTPLRNHHKRSWRSHRKEGLIEWTDFHRHTSAEISWVNLEKNRLTRHHCDEITVKKRSTGKLIRYLQLSCFGEGAILKRQMLCFFCHRPCCPDNHWSATCTLCLGEFNQEKHGDR